MIALKIADVKSFMSQLLIKDTFDIFNLSEATISTGNTFQISGEINHDFYTTEELENLTSDSCASWQQLRPTCFGLIKGSKTPIYMKIIFQIPSCEIANIINNAQLNFTPDDVNGLFINLKYVDNTLTLITGSSIKLFTMDKSLDNAFDKYICNFLFANSINYEEI